MAVDKAIDSGANLVEQWGTLSNAAIVGAVILGIATVTAVIIFIIFKYKMTKSTQDAKNERLREYGKMYAGMMDAINNLTASLKKFEGNQMQIMNDINGHLMAITNGLVDQKATINELGKTTKKANELAQQILSKTSGIIGHEDSACIIKLFFMNVAYNEIEKIVHDSLRKNDYSTRSDWILDRVKSGIGDILSECRSTLNDLNLSISIPKFFKIDSSQIKERFMLVNIIWGGIEEFYSSPKTLDQKLEESSLKLRNIIKDYLAEIFSQQEQTGFFRN